MLKVHIIDDHEVVRMGMKMVLSDSFPDVIVSDSTTFPEGLATIAIEPFDLIVLDINVPGGEETKMVDLIRLHQPDIKILVFSALDEEKHALRYLQAGANGFLHKNSGKEQYEAAIKSVLRNDRYLSSSMQQELLSRVVQRRSLTSLKTLESLSNREIQIAKMIVEGKWTKEIATILGLKENTISTFKKKIFEKTGVSNAIELAKKFSEAY